MCDLVWTNRDVTQISVFKFGYIVRQVNEICKSVNLTVHICVSLQITVCLIYDELCSCAATVVSFSIRACNCLFVSARLFCNSNVLSPLSADICQLTLNECVKLT